MRSLNTILESIMRCSTHIDIKIGAKIILTTVYSAWSLFYSKLRTQYNNYLTSL